MSIRYIFNTSGDYVAFIQGQYVFTSSCEWIGYLPEANIVYNTDGTFMGEVSSDDRIIRNKSTTYPQHLIKPSRPMKPLQPMRPLKRLRMSRLPYPYEDVFEMASNSNSKILVNDYSYLLGGYIIGSNPEKTFLGSISNNRFDQNSILNVYKNYGSKYSQTSIFNQYCPFGGKYGEFSLLNPHTKTPPKIIKNNEFLAWLTTNKHIEGKKIDSISFFYWLSTLS